MSLLSNRFSVGFSSIVTMVATGLVAVSWNLFHSTTMGHGTSNATVAATCEQLRGELGPVLITLPSDMEYASLSDENWSHTARKHPSCIALPSMASDVQTLIRVLVANQVPFAVRSGGHSTNPFDANIDTGVLIAMDKLDQVTYDTVSGLASVGPGARWGNVYTDLDQYGVTLVGGRVLNVGVGGFMLGGGLSYLSDLHGLACDNVASYELVLADGSIVEASSGENPDLFWALKGGANNFGIVTKFTLPTFPIQKVWGGVQMYTLEQMPDVLQAYHEYQTTPSKDLHANLHLNIAPVNNSIILTLVYLKPEERPAAYAPFYNLSPVFEQTGFMTLRELMGGFPSTEIPRWTWYVSSFRPDSQLFAEINTLLSTAPEISEIAGMQAGTLVVSVQPINENVALAGQTRGGNTLGLQAVNQTWLAFNLGWWNTDDDAAAYAAIESLHAKLETLVSKAGVSVDYIFMNDANEKQEVLASYGEDNVRRMHTVQQTYDPRLVFQSLVPGGQKIPTPRAN